MAYYAFSGAFTWSGAVNNVWDNATANWLAGGVASPYLNNAALVFSDTAAGGPITLNGTFSPASLSATNSAKAYTLTGGSLTGTMTLSKNGTGTFTLAQPNSYTGTTTITAGTLQFQGAGALPPTGSVQLGSGTLLVTNDGAGSNGTVALGNNIVISPATTAATIFAGNNGSSNSGNVAAFGSLSNGTAYNAQASTINFTGANGYGLSFSGLSLSGSTGNSTTLNPTSSTVLVGSVTNPETSFSGHYDTLVLSGTTTGNVISGAIGDSSGYTSVSNGDRSYGNECDARCWWRDRRSGG
jgi:autotransporter-associated beta strand protein